MIDCLLMFLGPFCLLEHAPCVQRQQHAGDMALTMHSFASTFLALQMKHKKGEENTEQEEEEHTVSVISNLFQGLSRGSRRDRVAAKFVENEFEKCDRLMELYNRYLTKVVAEQVRCP